MQSICCHTLHLSQQIMNSSLCLNPHMQRVVYPGSFSSSDADDFRRRLDFPEDFCVLLEPGVREFDERFAEPRVFAFAASVASMALRRVNYSQHASTIPKRED
eukprot:Opistho-2@29793